MLLSALQPLANDNRNSETNYSPQFAVASTFTAAPTPTPTPSSAGTKPLTKAIAAAALPGATGHILQSAVIAAYYLPAGYSNGSRSICTSNVSGNTISTALPCASSVGSNLGHYKGGAGQMDVAIGAAVAGMAFAVILVL